jgi:hypothetical protein
MRGGWDPKGPASIHRARAALDQDGADVSVAEFFESPKPFRDFVDLGGVRS